jgi:hypothetical protein
VLASSCDKAEDSGYEGDDEYSLFETPSLTTCASSVDKDDNEEGIMVQSFEIMIR